MAFAESNEVVLVVNSGVKGQHISQGTIRTIFGMRLSDWNENEVKVFVLPDDHPIHIVFTKKKLGMFPHQLRWAWDRQVFSGTGRAPIVVNTEEEMRQVVASTPGAFGYLRRSQVNGSIHELQIR